MRTPKDRTGLKFGRLTVLKPIQIKGYETKWLCQCDCGATIEVRGPNLDNGLTKSCGCLWRSQKQRRDRKSREGETRLSWELMQSRCYNPRSSQYYLYGARGITVCERWRKNYAAFLADMGERPEGTTLDRYPDCNGNYEPGNCRWATPKEQANNRRDNRLIVAFGKEQTLKQWAEEYKIPVGTLSGRLDRSGMPIEDALTKPVYWNLQTKEIKAKVYRNRKSNVFIEAFGQRKTLVEWSEIYGIKPAVISARIRRRGMTPEQAMTTQLVSRQDAWKLRKVRGLK